MIVNKNAQLTRLDYELQRANDDVHRVRIKNFDLETEL